MSVIDFPQRQPEDGVWVCNCGSTTHYHHADGSVECASCEVRANGLTGEWRNLLPTPPLNPPDVSVDAFRVVHLGSAESFFRRQIKDPRGKIVAAVAICEDGAFATYGDRCGEPTRAKWLKRKLAEAHKRMTGL